MTSNFSLPSSDFWHLTSNFLLPTSNFRPDSYRDLTSTLRLQSSVFRLLTSDFQPPSSDSLQVILIPKISSRTAFAGAILFCQVIGPGIRDLPQRTKGQTQRKHKEKRKNLFIENCCIPCLSGSISFIGYTLFIWYSIFRNNFRHDCPFSGHVPPD